MNEGPIYTRGNSYRARAEQRQREYRAAALGVAHAEYGHLLSDAAADEGANFVVEEAFAAALERQRAGKGVGRRTFNNMLSSQAMCFNVFAPLASRLDLATAVLEPFIDGLVEVTAIHIEHTPDGDVFRDQSGRGGVDCDVLIEGRTMEGAVVQVVETKFVEPDFSICTFRKRDRAKKGQAMCPPDVPVRAGRDACLYTSAKNYAYWERTDEYRLLTVDAVPDRGCPFGGSLWQLWVNLALAHEEAKRRGTQDARFAVCCSASNTALLRDGVIEDFRSLLRKPSTVAHLDLETLVSRIGECAPPELATWASGLTARYADI